MVKREKKRKKVWNGLGQQFWKSLRSVCRGGMKCRNCQDHATWKGRAWTWPRVIIGCSRDPQQHDHDHFQFCDWETGSGHNCVVYFLHTTGSNEQAGARLAKPPRSCWSLWWDQESLCVPPKQYDRSNCVAAVCAAAIVLLCSLKGTEDMTLRLRHHDAPFEKHGLRNLPLILSWLYFDAIAKEGLSTTFLQYIVRSRAIATSVLKDKGVSNTGVQTKHQDGQ